MNPEVTIPLQETTMPEEDLVSKFDKIFYLAGEVTRPSKTAGMESGDAGRIERSLLTRTKRAELLEKIKATQDREERRLILDEARKRDRIAELFYQQGEIKVNLPGLGEQTARYNRLPAYGEPEGENSASSDPIVIIPGISNDVGCVAAMAQELSYMGHNVVTLGYPEGFLGNVTPEFTQEVVKSGSFTPHAQFFKEAIKALTPDQHIELWGLSTGAPIAGEILSTDEDLQEKVKQAVFVSPAACVDQSKMQFMMGMAREAGQMMKKYRIIPKTIWTTGSNVKENKKHEEERKKIVNSLMKTIRSDSAVWKNVKVQDGGAITVVTGGRDQITKCFLAESMFKENPAVQVLSVPHVNHTESMNDPTIIRDIFSLRQ